MPFPKELYNIYARRMRYTSFQKNTQGLVKSELLVIVFL